MARTLIPVQSNLNQNRNFASFITDILKNKYTYILLLPGVLFYVIFCYGPMYGILLAFKDYMVNKGILGSPWVGLTHFQNMMKEPQFGLALKNTVIISFGRIITGFPVPIILAVMINELRDGKYKKSLQTVLTFPHFLSWVIVSGMIVNLFSSQGAVNNLISVLGMERQGFLANPQLFRPLLYISAIWKDAGWNSIIYLATISSINPEIYEAAIVDGANRFHRMLHVTWPGIKSTAVLLLILSVGNVMNAGFDQIFNMYNPTVYDVSDIIDTYIYRITFQTAPDYGFSTAVGLFKAVANFALLFVADRGAKLLGERGIF